MNPAMNENKKVIIGKVLCESLKKYSLAGYKRRLVSRYERPKKPNFGVSSMASSARPLKSAHQRHIANEAL